MESPSLKNLVKTVQQVNSFNEQLDLVNWYFNNRIRYAPDTKTYGCKEYWATPDELIIKGAGDCEDFALAKYFVLKEAGIKVSKMKIVYGRLLTMDEAHMFLLFQDHLVLDNLIDPILTLPERSDLVPICGFNHIGIWTFHKGVSQLMTRNSLRLVRWRKLLERLKE